MKLLLLSGLAAFGISTAASAATYTLDFSGEICGGPCVNNSAISQDYGDTPIVDVSHTSNTLDPAAGGFLFWNTGYSDLEDVAWGAYNTGSVSAALGLTPAAGYKVTLLSFQIGTWLSEQATPIKIFDGLGAVIADLGTPTIPTATAPTFAGAWSSDTGIQIEWANAWQFAIDNVTFEVTEIDDTVPQPAPIPLPASGLLLLAGLAGMRIAAKQRQKS